MNHRNKIQEILGPKGILARAMDNYEHRKQQIQMAEEVYDALQSDQRLVIEAPTGTGKTLAYLIAAALSGKKVAISTGTKNLQEQLFYKDVPFVRSRLFRKLKAALLKGRGNFVCHTRFARFMAQGHLAFFGDTNKVQEIVEWYHKTAERGQGDRAELVNLPDDDPIWPEICSTTETCLGKRCSKNEECFVLRMRARAAVSDLMIVNHHLLMSDLAVRESGFGEVIPRYEALVVDEAHGLEEAATQHFGFHLGHFRITRLARDTLAELSAAAVDTEKFRGTAAMIEELGKSLFETFRGSYESRERLGSIDPQTAELRDNLSKRLDLLASMLGNVPDATDELRAMQERAYQINTELDIILGDEPRPEYARWVERRDRGVMLHASPVEVGSTMRSRLYEKIPAIVFTSATLSSGGTFAYFKSRLGLGDGCEASETILSSPFDYARQTLLYIPRSIPEPNDPGFPDAVIPILEQVLTRTKGRAFVLFTSYRNMDAVYRRMQGRIAFPMLIQGSKPKSRLLEEFRELDGAVLFATSSFWEGVDVQGEALSCVIIDRLPFASPGDPIIAARLEKLRAEGKEHFYSYQVPMAVIALKQGLGRLIRTRSDRGILCILDLRILTKGYGKIFRQSLHESLMSRDTSEIDRFFSQEANPISSGAKRK